MSKRAAILLAALLTGTTVLSALAQAADEKSATQELEAVEGGLRLSVEREKALAAELGELARALEDLTGRMISLTSSIQAKEHLLSSIDANLLNLEKERTGIAAELKRKRAVLSQVLAGLQRLEQNPPPALVVEPNDILSALRGAMMFGTVVPGMKDEANHLIGRLERLAAIATEQQAERARLAAEFEALARSRTELAALLAEKQALAVRAQGGVQTEHARIKDLSARAQSLKQLLTRLAEDRADEEARKTAEQKAREVELERQRTALLARPPILLSRAKGKLDYPAQGIIVKQFGDEGASGSPLEGMVVATRTGAQVKSPADGKVEFAGPFRTYGQLLILDAGEGYLILMAGMSRITAVGGQAIRAGEPVGEMGDGPSSSTLLGGAVEDSRPVLYVEFRKQGKPVDPAPWWVGGRKEAMR